MAKVKKYYYLMIYPALASIPLLTKAQGLLEDNTDQELTNQTEKLRQTAGFKETTEPGSGIAEIISLVIYAFLGLLGVIFLIMIILAGANWMMAQGEEEKVRNAKDTIKSAIIGLIIVMVAYSVTYFVFASLDTAVSGTT
jgi:cytochrome bd-type quinol oxidase subunit 2